MIYYDYTYIDEKLVRIAIFNTLGDNLKIKTDYPLIGFNAIRDFEIIGSSNLKIDFRYSKDSLVWSDWNTLNRANLQNITDLKPNHLFRVEYSIENVTSEICWFKSVKLEVEYKEQSTPIVYKNFAGSEFFPYYNKLSLQYSANLLEKIFFKGIIPKFIKRNINQDWEDEDYIDLWWTIIYILALKYKYDSVYKEVLFRPELLRDFLLQRNLILRRQTDLGELYYLATHYYNEMRRRGTTLIIEDEYELPDNFHNVVVKGELLRYLNIENSKDIEFIVVSGEDLGWYVGRSYPGLNDTILTTQFIKGYELTEGVENLSLYPLINLQNINVEYDFSINYSTMVMTGINTGISYDNDETKLISINPAFSYEISCFIKIEEGVTVNIGIDVFDKFKRDTGNLVWADNYNVETKFFIENSDLSSKSRYVLMRAIVYGYNERLLSNNEAELNVGEGHSLKFKNNIPKYICPHLTIFNSISDNQKVNIFDFKVRLASVPLADYLSQENMVLLKTDKTLNFTQEEIINKYLIPYNGDLILQNDGTEH